ncbi:MAG: 4Fe-4S binding protein [Prolixibacteraceae bacterium]|nr:4Fe-4S binding protein [Prolixibacteraceae bacterium]
MRNGFNRQRRKGSERGAVNSRRTLFCVCNHCGYTMAHTRGLPCREMICPYCKISLVSGMPSQIESNVSVANNVEGLTPRLAKTMKNENAVKKEQSEKESTQNAIAIPVVDAQKCTGCGICVDACKRGAISLVKGIAHISPDLCVNCRLCVRKCPVGAIA